ncbi:hypothetical protein ACFPM1_11840 [Halorubrum rubrum]|uniref:Small CPxCG-related zinc finger protein n=1 Tax=Halorubrum rubrum TaxID=1126240 RepID=A0ABD5R3H0_9EURY|nr:hypothetical protein [Halorubrum rubrum]
MVDPTSDLGEEDEESAPRCASCGEPALGVERRTVTWVEDGEIERRHFCGEACREGWGR